MSRRTQWIWACVFISALLGLALIYSRYNARPSDSTSGGCRSCHQGFFELWATSWHGLSIRPLTREVAKDLAQQDQPISINGCNYQAIIDPNDPKFGLVLEDGPGLCNAYRIAYAIGGKDVCYLLARLPKGRLQVLPIAYDTRRRQWYHTTSSMVRHAAGLPDQALHWKDPALTFNSSCYCCHVSQIVPNYDPVTGTFATYWPQPGISCQTCHGSGQEHIQVCKKAGSTRPPNLRIHVISQGRGYPSQLVNSTCAPCHAKIVPITGRLCIGDDFFDHFDLATLEDQDFYPDGRDLGENYTYTQWLMSPCARSGGLDCLHCHTPSGRYRFADPNNANSACLPCHRQQVEAGFSHTHHQLASGPTCISCHMPTTEFARIRRTDHSMRPPMPAATIAFGSQNACNLCHADKDALWADRTVRTWHKMDYQAKTLYLAGLVDAARKGRWDSLPQILEYIEKKDRDLVFANALVRLIAACPDPNKLPTVFRLLQHDPSPLIRASAAVVIGSDLSDQAILALAMATRDQSRLVRVRAAGLLAGLPVRCIPAELRLDVKKAIDEYKQGLLASGYRWDCQYNLGNLYMDQGRYQLAIRHLGYAIQLRPDCLPAMVNAAICYDQQGRADLAEQMLVKAIGIDPNSIPARLNYGLLLGQMGRLEQAARQFQIVLDLDPNNPVAARNLAEINLAKGR